VIDAEGAGARGRQVLDDGLSRRLKALACTAPLHDLDHRKARLDWADASIYQMAEIALQVIDQVTISMDFDRGADHEDVVRRVLPFVAAQAPDRSRDECEAVARWVLDNLINVGSVDRGFRAVYGTFNLKGEYQRRTFDFKLLIELAAADGGVYLRASDESINVLVGALDTDVESAQIAAELKLENLIRRGRLSEAQSAAEQARYRTVQYAEILRRKLEATRRDVRAVDWVNEVPELIDEALTHIEARFRAEDAILTNITQARDEAHEPERKRKAAELIVIVRDCLRRHSQLQARLQQAGATFRGEQDRQQFSGQARRASVDLFGQLLLPTLDLPLAQAQQVAGAFFREATGVTVAGVPRVLSLVHLLLSPPLERDDLVGAVPEPEFAPLEDPDVFSQSQWNAADRLLGADDRSQPFSPDGAVPRRLSAVLAQARKLDPQLPHLIALRAFHSIDPGVGAALPQGDRQVLIAVDDGTVLDDPQFGGADLLLTPAGLDPERYLAEARRQARRAVEEVIDLESSSSDLVQAPYPVELEPVS
jgi:hypothetical protein